MNFFNSKDSFKNLNKNMSVLSIIFTNLIPLIFVFIGGSFAFVLIYYWLENAVIGLFNVLKMIYAGKRGDKKVHMAKFFLVPFFIFHFGIFMLVHLFFLVFLIYMFGEKIIISHYFLFSLFIGLIGFFISHGYLFVKDFIVSKDCEKTDAHKMLFKPYPRIIIMHLTIIFGAFLYLSSGKTIFIVILLIVLKTISELGMLVFFKK